MKSNRFQYTLALAGGLALAQGFQFSAQADYSNAVMNLNPIAYYRLGENVAVPSADLATNLGTLGGTAYYRNGAVHPATGALAGSTDTAATLDGASQSVALPYQSAMRWNGAFSVEAWLKPASGTANNVVPVSCVGFVGPAPRSGWLIYQVTGGWNFRCYTNSGSINASVNIAGGGAPVAGSWYHIVATYTTTNATLYVNGAAVASAVPAGTGLVASYNLPFTIGCRSESGAFWSGDADETAFYTNALTATDVAAHYQNGTNAARTSSYETLVQSQSPLLYFRLNEPAWSAPGTLPPTVNLGSLGATADGTWNAGAIAGASGPRPPEFTGFESNNTAGQFNHYAGTVSAATALLDNLPEYTLTAWIRRQVPWVSSLTLGMFCGQGNVCQFGWSLHQNDNSPRFGTYVWPASSQYGRQVYVASAPFNLDEWEHVAVTVMSNRIVVYANSSPVITNTENVNAALVGNGNLFQIGGGIVSGQRDGFPGVIDEVAVFTNALTAAQIQTLYDAAGMVPRINTFTRTPADPLYDGMTVTLTMTASGPGPISYQWRKGGYSVGTSTNTFVISNATPSDSGNYDVVLTNPNGSTTSRVEVLNIQASTPVIFTQPASIARFAGASGTFTVTAGGTAPLAYQWRKGTTPISGATASSFTLSPVSAADAGSYNVVITNSVGTLTSSNATLTVVPVTNYSAMIVASGPLSYWRFSETAGTNVYDYAGGRDGTKQGGITLNLPGMTAPTVPGLESDNTCFQFHGTNGYVPTSPIVNLNTNSLTIVALVKRDGPQGGARICGGFGGDHIALHVGDNGELRGTFHNISGGAGWNSGLSLPDSQWCFVAWVVEPMRSLMYLDDGTGLQVTTETLTSDRGSGSNFPLSIGYQPNYGGYFKGMMDEVALFRQSLTGLEITNLVQMLYSGPTAPAFVETPVSQAVFPGATVIFRANAIGAAPIAWQWKRAGTNLPGATQKTLTLTNVYYSDAGSYEVQATNPMGTTNAVATLTVALPDPTFANLTNGLVVHLKFDGDYLDSSGRGNHGTNSGASLVAGRIGSGALHYQTDTGNGTYNYVTLGTPADLDFGDTTSFSVAFWVKLPAGTRPGNLPFLRNSSGSYGNPGYTFAPGANRGGWAYSLNDGSSNVGLLGPYDSINNGNWHSLVHTFDRAGNAAVTYLDGVQVDTRALGNLYGLATGLAANIGQDATGYYATDGQADLDDLGIWTRALTAVEAQTLYRVGRDHDRTFDTYGPVVLTLRPSGASLEVLWQAGTLEQNGDLSNPAGWSPVPGASAPYYPVTPGAGPKFYRVKL